MKSYDTKSIRNICLVGHGGSGKTSLVETMLFNAGVTNRIGKVNDGNTVSDYLQEEVQRHISISTSLIPIEHKDVKVNVLDTPGYSDFIGEVISALRVVETSVFVISGVDGLEVQAEIIWDLVEEKQIPKIIFINKLDRENANAEKVLDQLKSTYSNTRFVQMQIPIGKEAGFEGVVGLFQTDIPDQYTDDIAVLKEALAEAAAEADDDILMKYLDGESLNDEELKTITAKGLAQNMIVPVLFGSVEKNLGVKEFIQFLADNVPAPTPIDKKAALVFKTLADPYLGKMTFFKAYGGMFTSETVVYNANREVEEKLGQLFYLRGKNQDNTASVQAGDIAVVAKLQETKTGDTFTTKEKGIQLNGIEFPKPALSLSVKPKSKGDEDKLGSALARLVDEDPTISVGKNTETKQTILSGLGEMQLDIVGEKLARKFGVAVETEVPKVPYRETIKKLVQVEGKHKKQSGGHGQYGHVWIKMQPNPEKDFEFKEEVFGGAVPRNYFPAVEKGLREAVAEGFLAGYPMTNVKFTLYDGSYHSVDSSEMAFKLAAHLAFKKGAEMANAVLMEPVVEAEVKVPEAFMGDVIGDLNAKRGKVLGMEPDGKFQVIKAHVPQSEMMRYSIDLKAMTQGRGTFTTHFIGYEEVPARLSDALVAQLKKEHQHHE
ncbi:MULTISPECIES: elongation factor G [unclassified Dehalobacter]|uniref:elongation factor G n=1 Tax=unclassified Dehalobacter TaxID=2635733 RepID=UPI000E6B78F6|nr:MULTISPECIES: elongation factor G [unclassified Dehalobacter]RJE46715.1 elongation factor G [Dehalobacter sp. MCB1]TCX49324.1 elongation factor G [Dehalobacter sp. 14DCB1]TCX49904.1 elongation factor G [Dehalobacter sp. 12DCB1]